jgi:hypothetical protein
MQLGCPWINFMLSKVFRLCRESEREMRKLIRRQP